MGQAVLPNLVHQRDGLVVIVNAIAVCQLAVPLAGAYIRPLFSST